MLPDSSPRLEQALAHEHFLRAVARGVLGGDADVDDVLQETFVVAWREAPRKAGSLRAWLATITRRLALDHRRSAGRRSLREGAASKTESLPSIDTIAAREETRRRLVAAVLALEEPYRTTMLWRYYEARSIPEIAELQAVPLDTVRTRLQRALARLRTRLDAEHGGDRRAWSALLSPLVPSIGGVAAAGAIGGGLLVKKVVVVAALLLLTLGGYAVVSRDRVPEDASRQRPPRWHRSSWRKPRLPPLRRHRRWRRQLGPSRRRPFPRTHDDRSPCRWSPPKARRCSARSSTRWASTSAATQARWSDSTTNGSRRPSRMPTGDAGSAIRPRGGRRPPKCA